MGVGRCACVCLTWEHLPVHREARAAPLGQRLRQEGRGSAGPVPAQTPYVLPYVRRSAGLPILTLLTSVRPGDPGGEQVTPLAAGTQTEVSPSADTGLWLPTWAHWLMTGFVSTRAGSSKVLRSVSRGVPLQILKRQRDSIQLQIFRFSYNHNLEAF